MLNTVQIFFLLVLLPFNFMVFLDDHIDFFLCFYILEVCYHVNMILSFCFVFKTFYSVLGCRRVTILR